MGTALYLALAILGVSISPAASTRSGAACRLIDTTYVSSSTDRLQISFARLPAAAGALNDLALHLRSRDRSVERWYYFDEGSARRVALISTLDPTGKGWKVSPDGKRPFGNVTYIGLDGLGDIAEAAPTRTQSPPRYIIIPELAEALRTVAPGYRSSAFRIKGCAG